MGGKDSNGGLFQLKFNRPTKCKTGNSYIMCN